MKLAMVHLDVAHRFQTLILAEKSISGNRLMESTGLWETKKMIGAVEPAILLSIVPMEIGKNKFTTSIYRADK